MFTPQASLSNCLISWLRTTAGVLMTPTVMSSRIYIADSNSFRRHQVLSGADSGWFLDVMVSPTPDFGIVCVRRRQPLIPSWSLFSVQIPTLKGNISESRIKWTKLLVFLAHNWWRSTILGQEKKSLEFPF